MRSLTIIPTQFCKYKCNFCYHKNSDREPNYIDDKFIKNFLEKNGHLFDRIIISGGEPMTYPKVYFDRIVDYAKKITNDIIIHTFPAEMNNYRMDVDYLISYDFVSRPYAYDAWQNMIKFPKKFDVVMTLTPQIFTLHPNNIFRKLLLLPNIKSIEIKPFIKVNNLSWKISQDYCDKYMKIFNSSRLNLPFININREKVDKINGYDNKLPNKSFDNYCLLPDGSFAIESSNEITNSFEYKIININDIDKFKSNIPYICNLYSEEIIKNGKINV